MKAQARLLGKKAQTTIEFTYTMIIVLLFVYGIVMIFRWVGIGLAERSMAHDGILLTPINEGWADIREGPLQQVDPNFYRMRKMRAVFGE